MIWLCGGIRIPSMSLVVSGFGDWQHIPLTHISDFLPSLVVPPLVSRLPLDTVTTAGSFDISIPTCIAEHFKKRLGNGPNGMEPITTLATTGTQVVWISHRWATWFLGFVLGSVLSWGIF